MHDEGSVEGMEIEPAISIVRIADEQVGKSEVRRRVGEGIYTPSKTR
jgi:hypothetical protein